MFKKMRNVLVCVLMAGLIVSVTGCTNRVTDFTVISTKNVDLSSPTLKRASERIEGVDTAYIILFIPTGMPNLKEAIDRAIEKVPGAVALVDGVVYSKNISFLVFGANSYVVEGTPLIDSKAMSSLPSNYMSITFDKESNDYVVHYLSQAEFEGLKQKAKI